MKNFSLFLLFLLLWKQAVTTYTKSRTETINHQPERMKNEKILNKRKKTPRRNGNIKYNRSWFLEIFCDINLFGFVTEG